MHDALKESIELDKKRAEENEKCRWVLASITGELQAAAENKYGNIPAEKAEFAKELLRSLEKYKLEHGIQ